MTWNFNMDDAPRAGYGEGRQEIIVAIRGMNKCVVTHWVPQDYTNQEGHWFGVDRREKLIAWKPAEHPSFTSGAGLTLKVSLNGEKELVK